MHFDEAGLASSPLLVARYGAYRLLRHTLVGFLPKTETENKKTPLLCNKKTKQLSLQQNEGRPSRSGATQRFAGAPSRFLRVSVAFRLAPRTARRAGREHRKTRRTLPVNTMHEFDAQAQKK